MAWTKTVVCKTGEEVTSYGDYLHTDHWYEVRQLCFQIHGRHCSVCGLTTNLNVHHKHYSSLGKENPRYDLIPLCKDCHTKEHEKLADIAGTPVKKKKRKCPKNKASKKKAKLATPKPGYNEVVFVIRSGSGWQKRLWNTWPTHAKSIMQSGKYKKHRQMASPNKRKKTWT